jgi:hypothetical protein
LFSRKVSKDMYVFACWELDERRLGNERSAKMRTF